MHTRVTPLVLPVVLLVVFPASHSAASTASYEMTGTVFTVSVDNVFGSALGPIEAGEPFTASFTLDTSTLDTDPDPNVGRFDQPVPPFSFA